MTKEELSLKSVEELQALHADESTSPEVKTLIEEVLAEKNSAEVA